EDPAPLLLVDDESRNLDALEATLEATGCALVRARSAEEALLALLDRDFAAIVLDVRMPGTSGFELAAIIRARKRLQHVPILFLTAHMLDDADIIRGYEVGAVDYLTKPINTKVLRSKIAVFVHLFRATQALGKTNEALRHEIGERQRAEEALRLANQELEQRVEERTAALSEAHAELQRADRRKDEFLATLAHELRNPLAPIRHAIEIARATPGVPPTVQWAAEVVERQARQMTRLVDDLLDVSRITRARLDLRREPVELASVIQSAIEACRPAIEAAGHSLTITHTSEPVVLHADPARLAQVFGNLLHNSAKYTGPGGHIVVSTERSDHEVVVRVRDTGIGIPAESLPSIFEMFTQVDRSLERRQGGLGVGLALAKQVVELHGGRIAAFSNVEQGGSEFVVTLPLEQATEPVADERPATTLGPTPRHRVLVADDNQDAAISLMRFLELLGHDVRVAFDGAAAIAVAEEFRPTFILMDIGMPRMNGYDAARRIRSEPWGEGIRMIALTGWGQEGDKSLAHEAGFDDHVTKPAEPEAIARALAAPAPQREARGSGERRAPVG
ncbi:MAG: ATP-binding response regulator, partial [Gemmatimonadaceae bacterium]